MKAASEGLPTAVITPVRGRHDHLRGQQASLRRGVAPTVRVVVAMGDPEVAALVEDRDLVVELAVPGDRLPLAAARNRGAAAALAAGAELLVFLDVDCLAGPDLVAGYRDAATRPEWADTLLSGPVAYLPPPPPGGYVLDAVVHRPAHPARPEPPPGRVEPAADPRLFWSLSFAVRAAAWARIGGFDEAYRGYGAEDTDFALRAVRAGVESAWVGGATAYHQWHPVSSPPVEHLDDVLRNGALFADRWGWWPMEGWLAAFQERGLIRRTPTGWARTAPTVVGAAR